MASIKSVTPLEGFQVRLALQDGTFRDVDLGPFLRGAVFDEVRENPELFRQVRAADGAVEWPTGQDIDEDVILGAVAAQRVAARFVVAMPTIARFSGVRISVQHNDHDPPHIHVNGSDADNAKLEITTGKLLKGAIKEPLRAEIWKWMRNHQNELLLSFAQAMAGLKPNQVPHP